MSIDRTESSFLEAIAADPADAALHRVYGDWLEEQGRSEQAMLVRLEGEGESGQSVVLCGDIAVEFQWCPRGTFTMGSPGHEPYPQFDNFQAEVTLTRGFAVGRTVVTQGMWENLIGTSPWAGESATQTGENFPAVFVDWGDMTAFCSQLTQRETEQGRLPTGWSYRLPTEAEWEYACRAGTATAFSFGDDSAMLADHAWFDDNTDRVREVGLKRPNPWGLYDVHGNVAELCADWYGVDLEGGTDPGGPPEGSSRVCRGGSFQDPYGACWSATRSAADPESRLDFLGFRVIVSPHPR